MTAEHHHEVAAASDNMRLIRITRSGAPETAIGGLPSDAYEVGAAYKSLYRMVGFEPPWTGYFVVVDDRCVGTCGFKSPPSRNRVEIAFFTFPGYEGKGYATRMAQALVTLCRGIDPALVVTAQTLPEEGASTTILRKLGFRQAERLLHPENGEVWEWRSTSTDDRS